MRADELRPGDVVETSRPVTLIEYGKIPYTPSKGWRVSWTDEEWGHMETWVHGKGIRRLIKRAAPIDADAAEVAD